MSRDLSNSPATFIPALTLDEALERIYALTGRTRTSNVGGSRAGKRALVALRDSLGLDIDIVETPADMARVIADRLEVEWHREQFTARNTVNLQGYNALLLGATEAFRRGGLARLNNQDTLSLAGREWRDFQPARSKIEAVTRIAALTESPREWLGPGSKEHKSVLINLANRLFPDDPKIDFGSKTRLAASLADSLGVPWTDECASTGETIQLLGLNRILAGAERYLGRLGTELADMLLSPEAEGDALAAALQDGLPSMWDGRKAIAWLFRNRLRGAFDNEWQGFYGEEQARLVLARAFTPKPSAAIVRYGNTVFDYSLNRVWDIKVHTEEQVYDKTRRPGGTAILLNDERAMRACVDEQGLGFLVISGAAFMDESGEFVAWHRRLKGQVRSQGSAPSNSGRSRLRKSAFAPLQVEAFWVANTQALQAAIAGGALAVRKIGRQAPRSAGESGSPRADKFEMRMSHARGSIRIARHAMRHNSGDEGT